MKVIRGQRLLQWLAEDSTYQELETDIKKGFPNTHRRQHATGPVHISKLEYIPYVQDGQLRVTGVAQSAGNRYNPVILFRGVEFEPNDLPTNITFRGGDNQEYHIKSIPLSGANVKVRCDCLDFYYRFAAWNAGDSSLAGDPPKPYIAKGNRPPANPQKVPGVCKHIIKTVEKMKQARIVT